MTHFRSVQLSCWRSQTPPASLHYRSNPQECSEVRGSLAISSHKPSQHAKITMGQAFVGMPGKARVTELRMPEPSRRKWQKPSKSQAPLHIPHPQSPSSARFVPCCAGGQVLGHDGPFLFVTDATEILLNLGSSREEFGPFQIRAPRELIFVRRDVAPASGISTFEPSAANLRVLLVDNVLVVLEVQSQRPDHVQTTHSGPDNSKATGGSQGLL